MLFVRAGWEKACCLLMPDLIDVLFSEYAKMFKSLARGK
jgi:hypothetical protein